MNAIPFHALAAFTREIAAWALILLGTGGVGLVLRMERKPATGRYSGRWRTTPEM